MKNAEQLGKPLAKTEQKNILGGNSSFSQTLMCKVTSGSDWIVIDSSYGNNAECRADMPNYCYTGGAYELCQCFSGDAYPAYCEL